MTEYMANEKNLKVKPIDSNFNIKQIDFYPELPFGIISLHILVNIEILNINFSNVEVNRYEIIGTKSDELVNALKQLGIPYLFGFTRQLSLRDKLRSNNLDKEMILYFTVNKEGLDYVNFKKFKDSLLGLKEIMEKIENTEDDVN